MNKKRNINKSQKQANSEISDIDVARKVFEDLGLDHHDLMDFGARCVKAGRDLEKKSIKIAAEKVEF